MTEHPDDGAAGLVAYARLPCVNGADKNRKTGQGACPNGCEKGKDNYMTKLAADC